MERNTSEVKGMKRVNWKGGKAYKVMKGEEEKEDKDRKRRRIRMTNV